MIGTAQLAGNHAVFAGSVLAQRVAFDYRRVSQNEVTGTNALTVG